MWRRCRIRVRSVGSAAILHNSSYNDYFLTTKITCLKIVRSELITTIMLLCFGDALASGTKQKTEVLRYDKTGFCFVGIIQFNGWKFCITFCKFSRLSCL